MIVIIQVLSQTEIIAKALLGHETHNVDFGFSYF